MQFLPLVTLINATRLVGKRFICCCLDNAHEMIWCLWVGCCSYAKAVTGQAETKGIQAGDVIFAIHGCMLPRHLPQANLAEVTSHMNARRLRKLVAARASRLSPGMPYITQSFVFLPGVCAAPEASGPLCAAPRCQPGPSRGNRGFTPVFRVAAAILAAAL